MTSGGILSDAFGGVLQKAREYLDETWDIETLSNNPDPTSASNETSVVQYAELEGKRILLTADVGPEGLEEAADYAVKRGFLRPHIIQIPHHGSRRNVCMSGHSTSLGKPVCGPVTASPSDGWMSGPVTR